MNTSTQPLITAQQKQQFRDEGWMLQPGVVPAATWR
jgi:hypothetical protein